MTKIVLWPDGTWCLYEDIVYMTHMSDDYDVIYLTEAQYDEFLNTGYLS